MAEILWGTRLIKKITKKMTCRTNDEDGRRDKMFMGLLGRGPGHLCVIMRASNQVFRSGERSITDAMALGRGCWMMDTYWLEVLRDTYNIVCLATLEKHTGILWCSRLDAWLDDTKTVDPGEMPPTFRNEPMTYLPTQHMHKIPFDRPIISM